MRIRGEKIKKDMKWNTLQYCIDVVWGWFNNLII